MTKKIKYSIVSFLVVSLLVLTSCGTAQEPKFENTMGGDFFSIGYPMGFSTSKLETGGILKNNEFTININIEPYAAAREGDNKSISIKADSIKSGLKDYVIEETENGVIISGDTEKGKGIVLLSPIDFYIVNVYTSPAPNSKASFDLAIEMIKTFEITNSDYFLEKEIDKNNGSMADNSSQNDSEDNSSNGNQDNSSEDVVDDNSNLPVSEKFENEHISFTIPKEWELTSDDSRITVLEPRAGSNLDVLSFSIQYVDLGGALSHDDFVKSLQTQTNGKKRSVEYSGVKYSLIQSSHNTYFEYHLVTKKSSELQIMVSIVSVVNSISESAIEIIESIALK